MISNLHSASNDWEFTTTSEDWFRAGSNDW
jgi:hypothetical protein